MLPQNTDAVFTKPVLTPSLVAIVAEGRRRRC